LTAAGPGIEAVIESTFLATARVHAKFWRSESLQALSWLALRKEDNQKNWTQMLGWSKMMWQKQKEGIEGVTYDPLLLEVMDASFSKMDWESHLARLAAGCFTLTQGDFHPYNTMATDRGAVLLDWELASAGSPGQELGQYMVNIDIEARRTSERRLVEAYRITLIEHGVPAEDASFEALWEEYVFGGAAKWVWVLPICIQFFPAEGWQQWFVDQVTAFLKDHGVTADNCHQPRKA
jgi:hypothetical protein